VDISMLDVQISMLNYMATMHALSGIVPDRQGNGHLVHVPYDTFRTKSRDLILAIITDNFWTGLVEVLDRPELRDIAFATQPGRLANRDAVNTSVQRALAQQTCEHWLSRLEAKGIPCAPVNGVADALSDPQVRARNMVVRVPHPDGGSVEMPGN